MGIRSAASGEEAVPFLNDERRDEPPRAVEHAHDHGNDDDVINDGDNGRGRRPSDDKVSPLRPRSFGSSRWHAKSPRTIVFLVSLLKFLVAFCYEVYSLPVFRLIEDMYCHEYLKDDSLDMIDEMQCKVDIVQSKLAYMLSWLNLTTSIISLFATLLFGTLADRVGRKPALKWNCYGIISSFPFMPVMMGLLQRQVRRQPLILLIGSLFPLVGGGLSVLLATLYAIASDVSSEEDKASSFIFISIGTSSGGFLGALVGGGLLQLYGPWVPIILVLLIVPLFFIVLFLIPETLGVAGADPAAKAKRDQNIFYEVRGGTIQAIRDLGSSFRLLKNPNIPLILVYFLFHNARGAAYGQLVIQYFSKNFGWQMGQISLLLSPLGVFNLAVLGLTPLVSRLLVTRFGFSGFAKDLWLSRLCTLVFIIGAVIEGFTTSAAVFIVGIFIQSVGYSNNPLARATMTHYVGPELTSSLYMLISVAEVAGVVVGAPVLAWLFTFGMERGGVLTGVPWFYCAFMAGVIWLCLALVRPPRQSGVKGVRGERNGVRDCEEGALEVVEVEMKALRVGERSPPSSSSGSHRHRP